MIKAEFTVWCSSCDEQMTGSDDMTIAEDGTQSREYNCYSNKDEECNCSISISLKFVKIDDPIKRDP